MSLNIIFPLLFNYISVDRPWRRQWRACWKVSPEQFCHGEILLDYAGWVLLVTLKTLGIHNKRVNYQSSSCDRYWVCLKRRRLESAEEEQKQTLEQLTQNFFKTVYGKVVQFRPLQTVHALMCKIHEQKRISVETCTVYQDECQFSSNKNF
jgi:hypothetical protein